MTFGSFKYRFSNLKFDTFKLKIIIHHTCFAVTDILISDSVNYYILVNTVLCYDLRVV